MILTVLINEDVVWFKIAVDEASSVQFTHSFNDGSKHMHNEQEMFLCVLPGLTGSERSEDLLQIPRIIMHDHDPILLIVCDFFPK